MTQTDLHERLGMFLEGMEPSCTEIVQWAGGQIELDLATYLTAREPANELVTSGRCIVLASDTVLVMTNPSGRHILPGGRRNPDERPRDAAIREVAEETGLVVEPARQLGLLVFRHRTPKPEIYPYPYPVFINVVYLAHVPQSTIVVDDTYELAGEFVDIRDEEFDGLPAHQQILLSAALSTAQVST